MITPMTYRNRVAIRLVRLLLIVTDSTRALSLPALASTLRVCERTVLRDLAALREAGIAVPRVRTKGVV